MSKKVTQLDSLENLGLAASKDDENARSRIFSSKPKTKKHTANIDGEKVDGVLVGAMFIHKEGKGWRVRVHGSNLKVLGGLDRDVALKLGELLSAAADWSGNAKDHKKNAKEVLPIVTAFHDGRWVAVEKLTNKDNDEV